MSYVKIHANRLNDLCNKTLENIQKLRRERDEEREKSINDHVQWILANKWRRFWHGKTREQILRDADFGFYVRLPREVSEYYKKYEKVAKQLLHAIEVRDDNLLYISIEDLDFLI